MPELDAHASYRDLLDHATNQLNESSDTASVDSEILLQKVVGQSLAWLIAHADDIAKPKHVGNFIELVEQRGHGQPVAYLIGQRDFWSLRFKVNPHVLIPRPDTETIVEQALDTLDTHTAYRVLDLGTGSGAIALAIAKERPSVKVFAVDSNLEILKVAIENAKLNQLNNIQFVRSNWFDGLANTVFDMIVSNPPYIAINDPHLKQGDLRFEPKNALISGVDGLDDIRIIVEAAPRYLNKHGHLILEHGFDQHAAVEHLLDSAGFEHIVMTRDLNNLPRCTAGQWFS